MNIIVHHAVAWAKVMDQYDIANITEVPTAFPVLLQLNIEKDDDDGTELAMDTQAGKSITTPEQAAKLLSSCSQERLLAIPLGVRQALAEALPKKENLIKAIPVGIPAAKKNGVVTATDSQGNVVTFTPPPGTTLAVGDSINLKGLMLAQCTIIAITGELAADSPIDNSSGIQEITDDTPGVALPGTDLILMDPSKLEPGQKIADLGDDQEHVLDVERAV